MTGVLWYLAETGAALAVFYGVYRLALPALGLVVVAFAEPQATMAQGAKTPGTVTAPKAEPTQAQADEAKIIEQKRAEEFKKETARQLRHARGHAQLRADIDRNRHTA